MKKDYARIRSCETGEIIKAYAGKDCHLPAGVYEMLDPVPGGCNIIGAGNETVKVTKK